MDESKVENVLMVVHHDTIAWTQWQYCRGISKRSMSSSCLMFALALILLTLQGHMHLQLESEPLFTVLGMVCWKYILNVADFNHYLVFRCYYNMFMYLFVLDWCVSYSFPLTQHSLYANGVICCGHNVVVSVHWHIMQFNYHQYAELLNSISYVWWKLVVSKLVIASLMYSIEYMCRI